MIHKAECCRSPIDCTSLPTTSYKVWQRQVNQMRQFHGAGLKAHTHTAHQLSAIVRCQTERFVSTASQRREEAHGHLEGRAAAADGAGSSIIR